MKSKPIFNANRNRWLVELTPQDLSEIAYKFYRVSQVQVYKFRDNEYSFQFQGEETSMISRKMSLEDLNETFEAFYYIYM